MMINHITVRIPPVAIRVVTHGLKNERDHCHDWFDNTVLKGCLDGHMSIIKTLINMTTDYKYIKDKKL